MGSRDVLGEAWEGKLAEPFVFAGKALLWKGHRTAAKQAYMSALAVHEALAAADAANIKAQADIADTCCLIAYALSCQGKLAEAEKFYARSLSICEKYHAIDPEDVEWKRDLAVARGGLGGVAALRRNYSEARDLLSSALVIREELSKADPGNMVSLKHVGDVHRELGHIFWDERRPDEALSVYRAALARLEPLVGELPRGHDLWRMMANIHLRIGLALGCVGQQGDAITSGELAHEIIKDALAAQPDDVGWLQDFFWSYTMRGDVIFDDSAAHWACLDLAIETAQRVVAKDPGNLMGYVCVATGLWRLSDGFAIKGDWPTAIDRLAAAREIMEYVVTIDPSNLYWQGYLAQMVEGSGEFHVAIREPAAARESYTLAISIYDRLAAIDLSVGYWAEEIAKVQRQLAELEEANHAGLALTA